MTHLTVEAITAQQIGRLEHDAAAGGSGAVVTFRGIVRPDARGSRRVSALRYDAYAPMAERQIARLADEAQQLWSLRAVRVLHRLGVVDAGQVSLVIVVGSAHRAEAYDASTFLIEQIKQHVPVWKCVMYDDGETVWEIDHAHA